MNDKKSLLLIFIIIYFLTKLELFGTTLILDDITKEKQPPFPPMNLQIVLSKIEPPLAEYMEKVNGSKFIPVVLILNNQLTQKDIENLFSVIKSKNKKEVKNEKRLILIKELKRLANTDQAQLVKYLRELEEGNQVIHVRPLWLTNVIGVKAPKENILRLTAFREIKTIHLDIPRPVKGETAWGVIQINADDVWSLTPTSYTGKDVTVAVLDTGVDYTHTDLINRMWINAAEDINNDGKFTSADNNDIDDDGNGYDDDVVGWNFSGSGCDDPNDLHGHGTHITGTIAGDGTDGTQTGVAPGARIMVLKESNKYALSTQQECWDGMQYALANGADIINFSSGWRDSDNPIYEEWRNNVTKLMIAGVLFVTIAHNDGSTIGIPKNIRVPGRVPLALTLGATDSNDVISSYSNNGPASWQEISPFYDYPWPPGLLKPDVSAPGIGIKSCDTGCGYYNMDGTSMAAPHACGTAALLLEKDPSLSPNEIKFILEETAVDLGDPGPDNAYGWGRIDALAALNYNINSTPYDLSVTGTNSVWTTTDIWVDNDDDGTSDTPQALSNNHLYARIRNIGGEVVTNAEIKFYYADVSTLGISGFDPDGDGNPSDGNFTYIGSYRVPTIGPFKSKHESALALVNWNIPLPPGTHWCVGIGIEAPATFNSVEGNKTNNTAFRNFFNISTSTASFDFNINPPPRSPDKPFQLEFIKRNIPDEINIELVIEEVIEKQLMSNIIGMRKIKDPLLNPRHKRLGEEYYRTLENEIHHVRYAIDENRAVLSQVICPKGHSIRARLIIQRTEPIKVLRDMLLIINTINESGERIGGFTININVK